MSLYSLLLAAPEDDPLMKTISSFLVGTLSLIQKVSYFRTWQFACELPFEKFVEVKHFGFLGHWP